MPAGRSAGEIEFVPGEHVLQRLAVGRLEVGSDRVGDREEPRLHVAFIGEPEQVGEMMQRYVATVFVADLHTVAGANDSVRPDPAHSLHVC